MEVPREWGAADGNQNYNSVTCFAHLSLQALVLAGLGGLPLVGTSATVLLGVEGAVNGAADVLVLDLLAPELLGALGGDAAGLLLADLPAASGLGAGLGDSLVLHPLLVVAEQGELRGRHLGISEDREDIGNALTASGVVELGVGGVEGNGVDALPHAGDALGVNSVGEGAVHGLVAAVGEAGLHLINVSFLDGGSGGVLAVGDIHALSLVGVLGGPDAGSIHLAGFLPVDHVACDLGLRSDGGGRRPGGGGGVDIVVARFANDIVVPHAGLDIIDNTLLQFRDLVPGDALVDARP